MIARVDEVAPPALMRLFGGTYAKTNMAEVSTKCHSLDCSGDSKVSTKLQIAIVVVDDQKSLRIEKNSNEVFRCLFIRCCK